MKALNFDLPVTYVAKKFVVTFSVDCSYLHVTNQAEESQFYVFSKAAGLVVAIELGYIYRRQITSDQLGFSSSINVRVSGPTRSCQTYGMDTFKHHLSMWVYSRYGWRL